VTVLRDLVALPGGRLMPTLIAIGYQDETTAAVAGEEVVRLSAQLGVPPEAVAVLTVDTDGVHHTITRVHGSGHGGGPIFWLALLGFPVFEPSGTPPSGAIRAAVEEFARPQLRQRFAGQVREILAPPASVLFLLVEDADPDLVLEAVKRYGGRTLRASRATGLPVPRHGSGASSGREEAVDGRLGRLETNVAGDGGGSER
jgi:uncharacterized membrane protein